MLKYFNILLLFISSLSAYSQSDTLLDFSKRGGLYPSQSFTIELIERDSNTLIFYTIDGSYPNSGSYRYSRPITIDQNRVIRAVGYLNGKKSKTITHSYIVDRKYELPVVSITCNPQDLWSYERGIYAKGCCADTVMPYLGANFWKNWERRANFELYEVDNTVALNQEVSIKIFGGFSTALPQKSLAIYARSIYGDNRFRYPIFPEKDIKKFKNFVLRNSGGDFNRTHLKDAFMTQMMRKKNVDIQAYRPAVVYLNGKYWGIQNLREKLNEHYLKYNYGFDKDSVLMLRHNGELQIGDYSTKKDYRSMLSYMRTNDLSKEEHINYIKSKMDVYNYIRYNIAETYSDNRDAGGNIRYWKHMSDTAKWRWILYDTDMGLGTDQPNGYKRNTVDKFTRANAEAWPDPSWSTFIIRRLLTNEELKNYYINTFADFLNTNFHQDSARALLDKMIKGIKPEMPYHLKRWNNSISAWEYQLGVVKNFIAQRPHYLRKYIMQKFSIRDTSVVNISLLNNGIQSFQWNTLKLSKSQKFNGVYFTQTPIPFSIQVKHDYEFIKLDGSGFSQIDSNHVVLNNPKAIIEPIVVPRPKSKIETISINEWSLSQSKENNSQDWIELYNDSDKALSLDEWMIRDDQDDHVFVLNNVTIPSKGYLIIAENIASFDSVYPDQKNIVGGFDFGFSAKGDQIRLYDNLDLMVDSLTFDTLQYGKFIKKKTLNRELLGENKWVYAKATPGKMNITYKLHLQQLEDEKKLKEAIKFWSIVGGITVIVSAVAVFLLKRYYKGKRKQL